MRFVLIRLQHGLANLATGPLTLAILPVMLLAFLWLGHDTRLLVTGIAGAALLVIGSAAYLRTQGYASCAPNTRDFEQALKAALRERGEEWMSVACIIVEWPVALAPKDPPALLQKVVRSSDRVFRLGANRFGIVLRITAPISPSQRQDMVKRFQHVLGDHDRFTGLEDMPHPKIGLCFSDGKDGANARSMIRRATLDLKTAHRRHPATAPPVHTSKQGPDMSETAPIQANWGEST